MARQIKLLIFLGVALIVPHVASANTGTPLMWAGMFHLSIGNLLIGICEGGILQRKYGAERPYLLLVGANYVSAWLGGYLLGWLAGRLDWNLNNGWQLFWLFVVLTYGMTILIEWPFVFWTFPKQSRSWKQALKASWLAQSCSYVVLFTGYWVVSSTSIYSRVEVVEPSAIKLADNLTVFYLGKDGRVYQHREILGNFVSTNRDDRLYFTRRPDETNAWDLHVRVEARRNPDGQSVKVAAALRGGAASMEESETNQPTLKGNWFNFGNALNVGLGTNAVWQLRSGFWAIEGLRVRNARTAEQYRFSWETPFSQWPIRNVLQLPNEQAIFQLGSDQICILDLSTRRIALLARGRGPAVLLQ